MKQLSELGKWITEKYRSQSAFAEKVGAHPTMVSRWLTGREGISPEYQDKIRGMKYAGPWPRQEAQEAAAPAAGPYITAEQFAEWRGFFRAGMEGVLERVAALEDQVRKLRQSEDKP